jgi:hypothetical protein
VRFRGVDAQRRNSASTRQPELSQALGALQMSASRPSPSVDKHLQHE